MTEVRSSPSGKLVETGGEGGTLADVLAAGNHTNGLDIVLENGSHIRAVENQNVYLDTTGGGNIVMESENGMHCTSAVSMTFQSRYNVTISTDDDDIFAGGLNVNAGNAGTDLGASISVSGGNSFSGGGDLQVKAGSSADKDGGNLILESGSGSTGRGDLIANVPTPTGRMIHNIGGNGASCVLDKETAYFTTQSDAVSNIKLLINNVDISLGIRAGLQDPQAGAVPGTDGDIYIRAAGALSNIYQMRGGVWVAL